MVVGVECTTIRTAGPKTDEFTNSASMAYKSGLSDCVKIGYLLNNYPYTLELSTLFGITQFNGICIFLFFYGSSDESTRVDSAEGV